MLMSAWWDVESSQSLAERVERTIGRRQLDLFVHERAPALGTSVLSSAVLERGTYKQVKEGVVDHAEDGHLLNREADRSRDHGEAVDLGQLWH